ncbi:MAG: hypothetical protein ACKOWW_00165 [Flavobacteriales bacterium]
MNRVVFLFFLLLSLQALAQRDFLVVFEGQIKDLLDQQNLYGVTLDVMQQDAVLTKVISDERGVFYASARIQQGANVKLRLTKGAYLTKYVALDLTQMKGLTTNAYGLQLLDQAVFNMYKLKPNVDLSFATNQPTAQYTWSANDKALLPNVSVQQEADAKAKVAYQKAIDQQKIDRLLLVASKYDVPGSLEKALPFYDSILAIDATQAKASARKASIQQTIKDEKELAAKKSEQAALLAEAQAAKTSGDLSLAEQKIKAANLILPGNSAVQAEQLSITNLQNEKKQKQAKQTAFQKAWDNAQNALSKGNTTLATQYFTEAEKIQPEEKPRVEQELQKIKNTVQDKDTEIKLNKILTAADVQFKSLKGNVTEKQLMDVLEKYKQADKLIALFHKQVLIDQYSKKLQDGMKLVTDKLDNLSTVYQSQLAKANEHYENDQLPMAQKVLGAPAMESRKNEPEVIELQKKIVFKGQFLAKNEGAYRMLKEGKDKQVALKALEDAQSFGKQQESYLKGSELPRLQKSIDSLKTILNPTKPLLKDAEIATTPSGIQLSAPGEAVADGSQAFNDLHQTRTAAQEAPYRQQQAIATDIQYRNYFSQQAAEVASYETAGQLDQTRTAREIQAKQNDQAQNQLQDQSVKVAQQTEVAINQRNATAEGHQHDNEINLQVWKDAKDYQTQQALKEQQAVEQAGLERINEVQNIKDLQARSQGQEAENKSKDLNQKTQEVTFTKQQQLEQAEQNSAAQLQKIQQTAGSRVELKTTPNYLKDENGVLFPSNTMTEKTYQIKNKEGFVTKVVVRRVVVDPNGHGVVFEQTTDEAGRTYFTRDGQVCTEYIWFNESTGASVLKK